MPAPSHTTIAVGLSGGVDSSVTAALLKQQGYRVLGLYMQNWDHTNDPHCTAEADLTDAHAVCQTLDIPLEVVNFTKEYQDEVFQHCLDEWAQGRTPNPDIWCNQHIKFKHFLHHALNTGADALATGHYAQIQQNNDGLSLTTATDLNKDQTYFLYTLNQEQLTHTRFPIGHLTKPQVRQLAEKWGLSTHNKKDSTGICFIGERRFKEFLSSYMLRQPGPITTLDGTVIGQHDGLMFYTVGQRQGLHIGGHPLSQGQPWYVADKNITTNTLTVVPGREHPALYRSSLHCQPLHWIQTPPPHFPFNAMAKTRYRQQPVPCLIHAPHKDRQRIDFDNPEWAITPGQSIVIYKEKMCLGGAIIESTPQRHEEPININTTSDST